MSSHRCVYYQYLCSFAILTANRPTIVINDLPDNAFVEIFSICRMHEISRATWGYRIWKWHRLAHVCRTWRHILFASSRHLHLEHVCTNGTPVKKNLGYLQAFPIVVSFLDDHFGDNDKDNIIAALQHRDRVQAIEMKVPHSVFEELSTAMQEPLPVLTHLRLISYPFAAMPIIPDTFLSGHAPRLQTIFIAGISFPAAPTLLSSTRDLVNVALHDIPSSGFIPPEAMVAGLAALSKLESLTLGYQWGVSYHGRIRLPPITRAVLPALTKFSFDGLFEYFEDFIGQIDAPQLNNLHITYLDEDASIDYQIPQLCEFVDRSEKLNLSRFRHAHLTAEPMIATVELLDGFQSSFRLTIHESAIGLVVNQLSALFTDVDRLFIDSSGEIFTMCIYIRWLEFFRPFTAVKALSIDDEISPDILHALQSITSERTTGVLPVLNLLRIKSGFELMESMKTFVAARQNVGRPVTIVSSDTEFQERLHIG